MKNRFHSANNGGVLITTLFILGTIGLVIIAAVSLVHWQNISTARSQAWNAAIPVAEAGIEEAMAFLNAGGSPTKNGWVVGSGVQRQLRNIGNDFYQVSIDLKGTNPIITATGYVRMATMPLSSTGSLALSTEALAALNNPKMYLRRVVRVTTEKRGQFIKSMACKDSIDMNGNNIMTDSYNSTTNLYSTNGRYDPAKARDNGDVATISGLKDAVDIGNADIKGRVRTGPGGKVRLGSNGKIGSSLWHATVRSGIEPGWFSDDLNIEFPDVVAPDMTGASTPVSGTINGTNYIYILNNGKYTLPNIDFSGAERIAVVGNATLLVSGDIKISNAASIDILTNGSLTLYAAGNSTVISGGGINNSGIATNCFYYGLPSNKVLQLKANGELTAAVYAPNADLVMNGGGSSENNFCGSCIVNSITINGHFKFHFDEALPKYGPPGNYVITSWVEL